MIFLFFLTCFLFDCMNFLMKFLICFYEMLYEINRSTGYAFQPPQTNSLTNCLSAPQTSNTQCYYNSLDQQVSYAYIPNTIVMGMESPTGMLFFSTIKYNCDYIE